MTSSPGSQDKRHQRLIRQERRLAREAKLIRAQMKRAGLLYPRRPAS